MDFVQAMTEKGLDNYCMEVFIMNENAKKVVKMIIYYVIAGCEKHDIEQCKEVINLQYDMLTNGGKEEFLESLINIFPKDHDVQKLYEDISKNGIEEMISAYDGAISAFAKATNINFSNFKEDEEVEKLADKLMSL